MACRTMLVVVLLSLCMVCVIGQQTPPPEPTANQAYVVSFRVITIEPGPETDTEGLGAWVSERTAFPFPFPPEDTEGFYDNRALTELYSNSEWGLVASVGPVYSLSMLANSEPKRIDGVTPDGEHTWWFMATVEPSATEDGTVRLHMKDDFTYLRAKSTAKGASFGLCDMTEGVPMATEMGWFVGKEREVRRFRVAKVVLVLVDRL